MFATERDIFIYRVVLVTCSYQKTIYASMSLIVCLRRKRLTPVTLDACDVRDVCDLFT